MGRAGGLTPTWAGEGLQGLLIGGAGGDPKLCWGEQEEFPGSVPALVSQGELSGGAGGL